VSPGPPQLTPAARETLLALADDEMCTGHRHAEWIGRGPFLEEDLALTSIAQDELGHAVALYGLLTDDVDGFALRRPPAEYRCAHLVELRLDDWGDHLVRHLLYDVAERVRWSALAEGPEPAVAGLAQRVLTEEAYHERHAVAMVRRLLAGTSASRVRVLASLERLLPLAAALFEPSPVTAAGGGDPGFARWCEGLDTALEGLDVQLVVAPPTGPGGRTGLRSPDFDRLQADMTEVLRLDLAASW
jgi:ring-1,2-phenylacetyl-CoA epoxidase subunit PaaC